MQTSPGASPIAYVHPKLNENMLTPNIFYSFLETDPIIIHFHANKPINSIKNVIDIIYDFDILLMAYGGSCSL